VPPLEHSLPRRCQIRLLLKKVIAFLLPFSSFHLLPTAQSDLAKALAENERLKRDNVKTKRMLRDNPRSKFQSFSSSCFLFFILALAINNACDDDVESEEEMEDPEAEIQFASSVSFYILEYPIILLSRGSQAIPMDTITPDSPPRVDLVRLCRRTASSSQHMPHNTIFSLRPSLSSPGPLGADDDGLFDFDVQQLTASGPKRRHLDDDEDPELAVPKRSRQETPAVDSPLINTPNGDDAVAVTLTGFQKTQKNEPPFADDYQPGGKSKAADYTVDAEAVILRSARGYEVDILVTHAFPSTTKRSDSATANFKSACPLFKKHF
jgi:hypothetical protein